MKYPIDKIIVMSLERTPERQWAWLGASAMMDVDPSIVYFALGKDDLDYGKSMQNVADAAAADGFPFVAEYAKGDIESKNYQQTAATVCQVWNYCRILRELIELDETALILFDDKMLYVNFSEFCQLIQEIQDTPDEEFYAVQLLIRAHYNEVELPEINKQQRMESSTALFNGMLGTQNESMRDIFFRKGVAGYDESIVFSPAGAAWMLKCLDMAPDYYLFLDHFIYQALPGFAEQSIKRGKGIYCPGELGYAFVKNFMRMGTTTDYAKPTSVEYDMSQAAIELNYLFDKDISINFSESNEHERLKSQLEKVLER